VRPARSSRPSPTGGARHPASSPPSPGRRRASPFGAHADEQAIIDGTVVAGQLSSPTRTRRFGVFLNDGTGSKMSYHIDPRRVSRLGSCRPAGQERPRQLTLQLTLTSRAPADRRDGAARVHHRRWRVHGTAPGAAEVVGNIYLPQGFDLVSATATNGAGFAGGMHEGRRVLTFGIDLDPGHPRA
jgi:hypothetical protein